MDTETTPKIAIEDLLSSRGRVKILKELAASNELLISQLCRNVNLNHSSTASHLKVLVKSGLIEEKKLGRIKIYRFMEEDIRARALRSFFNIWESK